MLPKWTVLYNIVSPENNNFVGTGWEFFDNEQDAQLCYNRQAHNGNVPTKRPFYPTDGEHLGAAHKEEISLAESIGKRITLICLKARLKEMQNYPVNAEITMYEESELIKAQIQALEDIV
jgi:hypothetical protein